MISAKTPATLARATAWVHTFLKPERIANFALYTVKRFLGDDCLLQAAGLSYVALLAMVPLFAIGLAILAAFPAFDQVRVDLQALVFQNFMPETGGQVNQYIVTFLDNASKASGPGVLALAVTALLLLSNINQAFNGIWRVPSERPIALRFLVYWALLTLGPLLIGSSLSLSSYAFAVVQLSDLEGYTGWLLPFSRLISIGLASLGLALIFFVVPNRSVRFLHAIIGGVIAALLFELLKVLFGIYLRHFPSYQAIYGALSTVPIFLLWMYLSWAVILFGAEVAAALPEWRAAQMRGRQAASPGDQLALALGLLSRLRRESRSSGGAVAELRLIQGLPAPPAEIDLTLRRMRQAGLVERSSGTRWVLARDLTRVTLDELLQQIGLDPEPSHGWPPLAEQTVKELAECSGERRRLSVEQLLARSEEEIEEG